PRVAARFHSRALTDSLVLETNAPERTIPGTVRDTGTNYYALRAPGRNHVTVAFHSETSQCMATVSAADSGLRRIGGSAILGPDHQGVPLPRGTDHPVVTVTVEPDAWIRPVRRSFQLLVQ